MRQRGGAGPKGTTYREILVEGFERHAAERAAIRKRYDARREANAPTPEDRAEWDEIGRQLRAHGEFSAAFSEGRVKFMRTHLFTHLRMALRFDPTSTGHYTIVRLNAPKEECPWQPLAAPEPTASTPPAPQEEVELTEEEQEFADLLCGCADTPFCTGAAYLKPRIGFLLPLAVINEWARVMEWVFAK